ncbi:hypothetical protein BDW68DRAFT_34812 [Aspergillus falconensis]
MYIPCGILVAFPTLVAILRHVCICLCVANQYALDFRGLKIVTWLGVWCCFFLFQFPSRLESDAVIRALLRIYVLLKVLRHSVPCVYFLIDNRR